MKTSKIPFYILIGFNILSWVIYVSNPYLNSVSSTHDLTVFYVLVNIIALYYGLKNGEKNANHIQLRRTSLVGGFSRKYLWYYFVFYILTFTLKYAYELRCPAFDISALVNRIIIGIASPDLGYQLTLKGAQSFSWSIYTIISTVDSGFFIIGMLCWKQMSKVQKPIFIVLVVFELLKWFGAGTSFGIMQICTTFVLVYVINMKRESLSKKELFRTGSVLLLVFIAAIVSFGTNMQGRAGGELQDITSSKVNLDSFVFKYVIAYLPEWFQNLYDFICRYLVGGYYNLEYMFQCDYDWTYFLGSTNALTTLADDIFHIGVESLNYQTKIYDKFGIDPYIYWHSCYAWWANDFTIIGVPFVVYWIGKIASRALSLYRRYEDLTSGIVFVILANTIIYFFANNNYFSGHLFFLLVVLAIWNKKMYKTK